MEINNNEENVAHITRDIKAKFDSLKSQVTNYQTAINKLQGEKQQLRQSIQDFQVQKSQSFNTPMNLTGTSTGKKMDFEDTDLATSGPAGAGQKSDAMIEYLRTEISLLRKKVLSSEQKLSKEKDSESKERITLFTEFMNEILRPAKDLIYQL